MKIKKFNESVNNYQVGDYVSVDISNYVADVLSDIERTEEEQEEVYSILENNETIGKIIRIFDEDMIGGIFTFYECQILTNLDVLENIISFEFDEIIRKLEPEEIDELIN